MKVAVWDTYVTKKDGIIMHFDIIVPASIKEEQKIYTFGMKYLLSKKIEVQKLTSSECQFCHIQEATESIKQSILKNGCYIYEMENCT
ncbi:MAG: DUF2024 domain-containing protein [Bacteroidetes bacterium HGW-Bacteroidetes-2]|jgi:hypothetical protein|nr:MAG: DUF2024 domain-containing protein [Bacteroidetes bacterium HGW-Bacteroidetes-2]